MSCHEVLASHLPANVRARTRKDLAFAQTTIVCVETDSATPRADWPRDEFFEWFDRARPRAGFKNEYELARAAKISHSAISGWRTGRQRPSTATLSKLAQVMNVPARDIWIRAGALAQADLEAGPAPMPEPDDWGVEIIRDSKLSREAQDKLIAIFREQERRDREERARRLREQIDFLDSTSVD